MACHGAGRVRQVVEPGRQPVEPGVQGVEALDPADQACHKLTQLRGLASARELSALQRPGQALARGVAHAARSSGTASPARRSTAVVDPSRHGGKAAIRHAAPAAATRRFIRADRPRTPRPVRAGAGTAAPGNAARSRDSRRPARSGRGRCAAARPRPGPASRRRPGSQPPAARSAAARSTAQPAILPRRHHLDRARPRRAGGTSVERFAPELPGRVVSPKRSSSMRSGSQRCRIRRPGWP